MAKNKVIIPVSAEIDLNSLKKAGESLKGLSVSTSKAVSETSKQQAQELLNLYETVRQNFEQQMSSGKMSKESEELFSRTIASLKQQIASLGKGVAKELKDIDISAFDKAAQERLKEMGDGLEDIKKEIAELDNIELKSLRELFTEQERENLGIQRFTALTAAAKDLKRQEEKLEKLGGMKKRNEAQEEEYQLLLKTKAQRKEAYTQIVDQIKVSQQYEKRVSNLNNQYKEQTAAIQQFTAEQVKLTRAQLGFDVKGLQPEIPFKAQADAAKTFSDRLKELTASKSIFSGLADRAKDSVLGFATGLLTGKLIIDTLRKIFKDMIKVVKELDQAFIEIAMVTTYTTKEVWKMKDAFVAIANTTGLTVSQVTKLAGEFFRQGRSYSEVLKLTEAAGVAARIAGISAGDSVRYLTSAINAYQLSANQAMAVSDKFAALAASSATNYEELAIALSKVAAQAFTAGVNLDNMMGFIAKALETTREAPENIGTAFKTIFARMSELKDLGATVEDGMDIGRVDTALKSIGVNLTNQNKELRNLDEVLIEVGRKWSTLNKNQKAYVATALAGTRQQTRLLAVFENFDRTMELAEISSNSLGASLAQQQKFTDSVAYAVNQLQVAWQDFVSSLVSSDLFVMFYKTLAGGVGILNSLIKGFQGVNAPVHALTIAMVILTGAMTAAAVAGKSLSAANIQQLITTSLLGKAYTGLGLIVKSLAAGMSKLAMAIASNPILWPFVALTTVLVGVAVAAETGERKIKNMMESVKKTQAEVFNLRRKADDLDRLVNQYEEIDKSVVKTNADLEKQADLLQQIQDLVGDDFLVAGIGGELQSDLVRAQVERLRNQADTQFDLQVKQIGSLEKAYNNALKFNDAATQQFAIIALAMKNTGKSYSDFISSERELVDLATKRARIELGIQAGAERFAVSYRNEYGGISTDRFSTREKAETVARDTGGTIEVEFVLDEARTQEVKDEAIKFFDSLKDSFFFDQEDAATQARMLSGFFTLPPEAQNALKTADASIGNVVSAIKLLGYGETETGLDKLSALLSGTDYDLAQLGAFSKVIENLPFDETINKATILENVIKDGPDAAIKAFGESGQASLIDVIRLSQTLIDTMSTITFENLAMTAKSLNSTFESMEKINQMLSGQADYDIAFMNEMLIKYPMLNDMIAEGNALTEEQIKTLANEKRKEFEEDLTRKEAEIQLTIDNNNIELALLRDMMKNRVEMEEIVNKMEKDENGRTILTLQNLYNGYFTSRTDADIDAFRKAEIQKLRIAAETAKGQEKIDIERQISSLQNAAKFSLGNLRAQVGIDDPSLTDWEKVIQDRINTILSSNTQLQQQLTNIANIRRRLIASGSLLGQKETKEAKEYEAQLNEIYVLTQQLAAIQEQMRQFQFNENNAKTGTDWLIAIKSQNAALETQNKIMSDLVDTYRANQQSILNSLGPLQDNVKIVNGRLIPIMSKYNKVSAESKQKIDAAAEAYNNASGEIANNSMAIQENTAAVEANLQKIEEATTKLYDELAEAIKNYESKRLEVLKKGFEEEKRLLDNRRKLYEDAFSEQDFNEKLAEQTKERQNIIRQLSRLEGATDLGSLQRRKELTQQLTDLNKNYNDTVRDYSRKAILDLLTEEQSRLDESQKSYEQAYKERVESVEWLEGEITRIMNNGLDYTIQYLQDNSPRYEQAWTHTRDNIEREWIHLYEVVNTTVEDIANSIPDFSGMINQLREAARLTGQISSISLNTGGGGGGGGLTPQPRYWTFDNKSFSSKQAALDYRDSRIKDLNNFLQTTRSYAQAVAQGTELERIQSLDPPRAVYKQGGIADFTGPAWLDGTKQKPERVLSPFQTELFEKMVRSLEMSAAGASTTNTSETITIGNITIQTPQLNTNADFGAAGRTLAAELKAAMSERGLNINKKK